MPDITNLATNTTLNEILNITNLATTTTTEFNVK